MTKLMMPAISLAALVSARPDAVIGNPRAEIGNVDQLLKDVKAEITRVGSDVRKIAEDALKQAKDTGDLTAETKAEADKLLTQYNSLTTAQAELKGKIEALESRSLEVEQLVAQGGRPGQARVTAGQEISESDELKAYVQGGCSGSITLRPSAAITSVDGSGGGLIWPDQEQEPVNLPRQTLPIRSLLTQATTETNVINYPRQVLRTNAAAPTAEGAPAPESSYGWNKAEVTVKKIAHVTHASDEALADAGQMQSLIDSELRYGLDLEEEQQILAGDGVGENLDGLLTNATAFSAAAGLPNATRIDRLRLGILQVALANYAADAMALHPTDWAAIELLKDTQNRYIFGDPNAMAGPRLWSLPVVPALSMTVNEWLVGAFRMAATYYDRQQTEVLISSEHGTNFVDGMKTMKGVKRAALAVKRPAALITGNFTFV
ncbi:phage major capsid protein [Aestuariibius sp. 2305UL40-4]|uniref:phage major capsid protein n=1 Tax=Aestuariibius violaceus TaxID=3234132 RepID=UPI00345E2062